MDSQVVPKTRINYFSLLSLDTTLELEGFLLEMIMRIFLNQSCCIMGTCQSHRVSDISQRNNSRYD